MKTVIKMLIWKYVRSYNMEESVYAYQWLMKVPAHKRLIGIWCIKHHPGRNYQELLEWITRR